MLNNENYSWENYFKHPFFMKKEKRNYIMKIILIIYVKNIQ